MRAITFPYTVHKGVAIPYIPLTLKINHTPRRFWAFVDSGATFSIFKASEIEDLKFDYRSGRRTNVQVGDGGFIPVYLHRLEMTLDQMSFSATVGFSARLGVEFNLLGRKDVFELFDVTFSDSARQITFTSL
jgi:hypothetical protein